MVLSGDCWKSANDLYNDGWRTEDRDELIQAFALSRDEADIICEELKRRETWYAIIKDGEDTGRGSFDKEMAIHIMHYMNGDHINIIDRRVYGHEVCVGQIKDVVIGG